MKSRTPARNAASALSGSASEPIATIWSPGYCARTAFVAALAAAPRPPEKSTNTSDGLSVAMRCVRIDGSSVTASTAPAASKVSESQCTCSSASDANMK